ncbi:hypothetical protein DICPUDRAFT_51212 [Dictyostelium purpureum]|uniref:V-SNARE coiled-coil homology domain-containing protein n=1 Tax=Dictyostelium purpureum TaxID=5786 RepID=F1A2Q7_DICPU|nr:uncharacterized protein DICPUDRAFT_51212 [Dictyostelium purpureum]EGC29523.1 hypothetical protein DICPUDRAFT_51212 [Dictyostelium purpureum]|eukprot:XP_003293949.1 hypothetical protein DICPUDRAFT_51212 [Dictyostelium purpureum]
MKLVAMVLAKRKGDLIEIAADLGQFGFFERGTIKEVIVATSKIFINQFDVNTRTAVPYEDYICIIDVRSDFGGVVFTDKEYPERVAVKALGEMMGDYVKKTQGIAGAPFPELTYILQKYQDPKGHDKILDVQNQVNEIIPIMHKNIDVALGNTQKMETLLEQSNDLSSRSKLFLKQAKKANRRCCIIQ